MPLASGGVYPRRPDRRDKPGGSPSGGGNGRGLLRARVGHFQADFASCIDLSLPLPRTPIVRIVLKGRPPSICKNRKDRQKALNNK
jgi:hypothetical protein